MAKAAKKGGAKKGAASKGELAETGTSALEGVDPAMLAEINAGHEEVGAEDVATPFLVILQPLSPACVAGDDQIDGATAGQFMNTVDETLYDSDGVYVIPCHFQARWVEWRNRALGGGFVRQYDAGEYPPTVKPGSGTIKIALGEDGQPFEGESDDNPAPTHAIKTHMHFVLLAAEPDAAPDQWQPAVFAVSSTGLTPSGRWNSALKAMVIPGQGVLPRFAGIWRLQSTVRSNDKGTWFSFKAHNQRRLRPTDAESDAMLFGIAKAFKETVMSDELTLAYDQMNAAEAARDVTPPAAAADNDGGDIL